MKVVVVGSGIIGLATARRLAARGDEVVILEKEAGLARHQTGRNSGVVHSGLYYPPGSLKATMAVRGAASIQADPRDQGVAFDTCGKLVVAVTDEEVPRLRELAARAEANGVPAWLVGPAGAHDHEPCVWCVEALRVETTGALRRDGSMVDDFLVQSGPRQLHVLNAPSPAATASLEIADHLVREVDRLVSS